MQADDIAWIKCTDEMPPDDETLVLFKSRPLTIIAAIRGDVVNRNKGSVITLEAEWVVFTPELREFLKSGASIPLDPEEKVNRIKDMSEVPWIRCANQMPPNDGTIVVAKHDNNSAMLVIEGRHIHRCRESALEAGVQWTLLTEELRKFIESGEKMEIDTDEFEIHIKSRMH